MKTASSGHPKVKLGWKLLAGLPKKRGRGSAVTPRRKPSPASPSNSACNRPQKPTLTRTGTERPSLRQRSRKFAGDVSTLARQGTTSTWVESVGPLEGGRSHSVSSQASRLRCSVEMHRKPSSGIMHRMFVVRRGTRIGKEETNVCAREQDLV